MSWTEIKHSVNSDLHKPLNELIEEQVAKINSNTSKPLDTLIEEYLANPTYGLSALLNAMPSGGSVVKSVQRGEASSVSLSSTTLVRTITINSVNPSKSVLFVTEKQSSNYYGSIKLTSNGSGIEQLYYSKNSDGTRWFPSFMWQVIEFN